MIVLRAEEEAGPGKTVWVSGPGSLLRAGREWLRATLWVNGPVIHPQARVEEARSEHVYERSCERLCVCVSGPVVLHQTKAAKARESTAALLLQRVEGPRRLCGSAAL